MVTKWSGTMSVLAFRSALGGLACCFFVCVSWATTWHVDPDGGGEVPTIAAAIERAALRDTILLSDGTFRGPGNRDLNPNRKSLLIRSESGDPATCILDCEGTESEPHRGFLLQWWELSPGTRIVGITILHAVSSDWSWPVGGSAVDVRDGATARFTSCVFRECLAADAGCAATILFEEDCSGEFVDCLFAGNHAEGICASSIAMLPAGGDVLFDGCRFEDNVEKGEDGPLSGGIACGQGAHVVVRNCTFTRNVGFRGGALEAESSSLVAENCRFEGNVARDAGGAIWWHVSNFGEFVVKDCVFSWNQSSEYAGALMIRCGQSPCNGPEPSIQGCTFVGNRAPVASAIGGSYPGVLQNTIIAFGAGENPVDCEYGPPTLRCCDVFGNQGGDWVGCIAGQEGVEGNFAADPLFCGLEVGDFSLNALSPCLPGHHPAGVDCGLIGTLGQGCGSLVGACCLTDGSCAVVDPQECEGLDGVYQGDGVPCEPDPCEPTAVEETTWGRVRSLYR